jgi:hypothetical protein
MKTVPLFFGRLFCLAFLTLLSASVFAGNKTPVSGGTSGLHRSVHTATDLHRSVHTITRFHHPLTAGRSSPLHPAAMTQNSFRRSDMRKSISRMSERKLICMEAANLFDEMKLKDSGLDERALECGLLGYHRLLKKGALRKTDVLSICDFSQGSASRRLYVIDIVRHRLIYRTYVAHGICSGSAYANSFSNSSESHKSSLGFYVTGETYFGGNGLSLRIDGLDRGYNTMARRRNIVIHGAPYVSERILSKFGVMGTTFGCPAIPEEMTTEIIPVVKGGTCFFIYYPSKEYLIRSVVLNG